MRCAICEVLIQAPFFMYSIIAAVLGRSSRLGKTCGNRRLSRFQQTTVVTNCPIAEDKASAMSPRPYSTSSIAAAVLRTQLAIWTRPIKVKSCKPWSTAENRRKGNVSTNATRITAKGHSADRHVVRPKSQTQRVTRATTGSCNSTTCTARPISCGSWASQGRRGQLRMPSRAAANRSLQDREGPGRRSLV